MDAVLARSVHTEVNRFDWLAELRASCLIQTDDVFEQRAIGYVLEYGYTHQRVPHNAAFQALLGWQRSGVFNSYRMRRISLNVFMIGMGMLGKEQLWALIPHLVITMKGYPYLGQVHAEYIR